MTSLKDIYGEIEPGEGPFVTEYLWVLQKIDPTVGLDAVTWNDTGGVYDNKDEIIKRFNCVYRYREIGSETVDRFIYSLQRIYWEVVDKYDRAIKIYADNASDMDNISTYNETTVNESEASPPATLLTSGATSGYSTSISENSSRYDIVQPDLPTTANHNIDEYRTLINDFVEEFDKAFMMIMME